MDYSPEIKKLYLGLRQPQAESLKILEKLADILELKKDTDVVGELEKVKALYPTCASFERDFPSVCFRLFPISISPRELKTFSSWRPTLLFMKN